ASAIHDINIAGYDPNVPLDDNAGVGGIDIANALQVIDNGLSSHYTFTAEDLSYDKYFYVNQGQKVRAVIRWDSKAYNTDDPPVHWDDRLEANLNLIAHDPNGNYITGSFSYDNNYEILAFTANTTGNYRVRIEELRFDGSEEYVGLAICKY
ncbi:MAG: hypothetical protein AB1478_11325, partial [Nitrospirota bacterium]